MVVTEKKFNLHGLGFLQFHLPDGLRLHVWHPDLPKRENAMETGIHDHRYGFESTVLVGSIINEIYDLVSAEIPTHNLYTHDGPRLETGQRAWVVEKRCRIKTVSSTLYVAGQVYSMKPYQYHSSIPAGKVVTLIRKFPYGKTPASNVGMIGFNPDIKFDRYQLSAEEAADYLRDCFI
jgi:hypothetical protein